METAQQEQLRRRYLADQVEMATPVQRLLMLFDQLTRDLETAEQGFDAADLKMVNDGLVHAQHILFALRDPLSTETPLGRSLAGVYSFCLTQLLEANIKKDRTVLPPIREMLMKIAAANRRAAIEVLSEPLSEAG